MTTDAGLVETVAEAIARARAEINGSTHTRTWTWPRNWNTDLVWQNRLLAETAIVAIDAARGTPSTS